MKQQTKDKLPWLFVGLVAGLLITYIFPPKVCAQTTVTLYTTDRLLNRYAPVCNVSGCYTPACRLDVAPAQPGELWTFVSFINATNDDLRDRGRPAGWSTGVWVCKVLGEREYLNETCRRAAPRGGSNISPDNHHDERNRTGMFVPEEGDSVLVLLSWAYNKRALPRDRLRHDGCELTLRVETGVEVYEWRE